MIFEINNGLVSQGLRDKLISKMNEAKSWGSWIIEISKKRKKRSENQNDFYWGPFLETLANCMWELHPLMDDQSKEKAKKLLHSVLKEKFLPSVRTIKKIRNPKNPRMYISLPEDADATTTTLSTQEFETYLEKIRTYFGRWWWSLPYPDPHHWDPLNFNESF